jgi:hypothetical protein
MRAIQKLPADRFQTADAMAEQLEEVVRSRSGLRGEALLVHALEIAGLVTATEGRDAIPARRTRESARGAIAGLAILGAIGVLTGAVLQASVRRDGDAAGTRPLDLLPASAGYLRVLATPWAEVWVDGQRVDVTPFARPIPLPEGAHFITLVHPTAPAQKHTVSIAAGETRTLDVVMAIQTGAAEDAAINAPVSEKEKPR